MTRTTPLRGARRGCRLGGAAWPAAARATLRCRPGSHHRQPSMLVVVGPATAVLEACRSERTRNTPWACCRACWCCRFCASTRVGVGRFRLPLGIMRGPGVLLSSSPANVGKCTHSVLAFFDDVACACASEATHHGSTEDSPPASPPAERPFPAAEGAGAAEEVPEAVGTMGTSLTLQSVDTPQVCLVLVPACRPAACPYHTKSSGSAPSTKRATPQGPLEPKKYIFHLFFCQFAEQNRLKRNSGALF